jgi:hypothetical protein
VETDLVNALLRNVLLHWEKGESGPAWESIQRAFALQPDNIITLYDIGVMEWFLTRVSHVPAKNNAFQSRLTRFLKDTEQYRDRFPVARTIAESILQGRYDGKPPIMALAKSE